MAVKEFGSLKGILLEKAGLGDKVNSVLGSHNCANKCQTKLLKLKITLLAKCFVPN